jgi:hypothetical protein
MLGIEFRTPLLLEPHLQVFLLFVFHIGSCAKFALTDLG